MKPILCILMGIFAFLSGCSKSGPIEGGLYYTPGEKGGYTVLKVLKIDDKGVHVRLYSNQYSSPPTHIDEATLYMAGMNRKEGEALGMGHLPLSKKAFEGWKAVFIQQSTVNEEELDGYKEWQKANGGYW